MATALRSVTSTCRPCYAEPGARGAINMALLRSYASANAKSGGNSLLYRCSNLETAEKPNETCGLKISVVSPPQGSRLSEPRSADLDHGPTLRRR